MKNRRRKLEPAYVETHLLLVALVSLNCCCTTTTPVWDVFLLPPLLPSSHFYIYLSTPPTPFPWCNTTEMMIRRDLVILNQGPIYLEWNISHSYNWSSLDRLYIRLLLHYRYYGDAAGYNKDDMIHYHINDVGRDTASASRVYIALIIRYYITLLLCSLNGRYQLAGNAQPNNTHTFID